MKTEDLFKLAFDNATAAGITRNADGTPFRIDVEFTADQLHAFAAAIASRQRAADLQAIHREGRILPAACQQKAATHIWDRLVLRPLATVEE